MSQENVENLHAFLEGWDVRATLEAWNRGEADVSLLDPEVTYEDTILPDHVGETYRGHDGLARATQRWIEAYEQLTIQLERLVGSGDRFVSIHRVRARARHTGIESETPLAYFWTFRDGKVVHLRSYWNPAEALEAAGLSEQAMSQEDLIHAMYEAWCEGNLAALLETCDPQVEFLPSGSFPDFEPVYRGHDGVRVFWDAMRAPWEWVHLHAERIIEGKDRAAVIVHFRARGRGSGVMTDLHQGHAMQFKNGRVAKLSAHPSLEQALEAVGLSEQDAHADS